MEYAGSPLSRYWSHWSVTVTQAFYPVSCVPAQPVELIRLRSEKEILEKGLADCVTYLHALRQKHVRNQRVLLTGLSLPRKKKKQIQQSKHNLEREIKNRERDEQAFLNNLQACKANIYLAEILSYPSTGPLSTVPDFSSGSTRYSYPEESEPTEFSWNGNSWAENAAISPFQTHNNNAFLAIEVAPDDCLERTSLDEVIYTETKHPSLPVRHVEALGVTLPVPPNTAQSQLSHSSLSPEAAVFQPYVVWPDQEDGSLDQQLERLSKLASLGIECLEHMQKPQVTDGGVDQVVRELILQQEEAEETRNQTWCSTTPQRSPNKDTKSGDRRRSRTKSL